MTNNYTMAASERLQEAVQLAQSSGQSMVEPLHLLVSILRAKESINHSLLERAGGNLQILKKEAETLLSGLPTVIGSQSEPQASKELSKVLQSAEKSMKNM